MLEHISERLCLILKPVEYLINLPGYFLTMRQSYRQ